MLKKRNTSWRLFNLLLCSVVMISMGSNHVESKMSCIMPGVCLQCTSVAMDENYTTEPEAALSYKNCFNPEPCNETSAYDLSSAQYCQVKGGENCIVLTHGNVIRRGCGYLREASFGGECPFSFAVGVQDVGRRPVRWSSNITNTEECVCDPRNVGSCNQHSVIHLQPEDDDSPHLWNKSSAVLITSQVFSIITIMFLSMLTNVFLK